MQLAELPRGRYRLPVTTDAPRLCFPPKRQSGHNRRGRRRRSGTSIWFSPRSSCGRRGLAELPRGRYRPHGIRCRRDSAKAEPHHRTVNVTLHFIRECLVVFANLYLRLPAKSSDDPRGYSFLGTVGPILRGQNFWHGQAAGDFGAKQGRRYGRTQDRSSPWIKPPDRRRTGPGFRFGHDALLRCASASRPVSSRRWWRARKRKRLRDWCSLAYKADRVCTNVLIADGKPLSPLAR